MSEVEQSPSPTATVRLSPDDAAFILAVDRQLKFQVQWRRLMMNLYVVTTTGTILATSCATLMAALDYSRTAAVLAGLGTVLVSLEKAFCSGSAGGCTLRSPLHLRGSALTIAPVESLSSRQRSDTTR